jgi:hypothetical protein
MATSRIYLVTERDVKGVIITSFLIRAQNQSRAIRHVAKRFAAKVASQDQLVELAGKGVKVQEANAAEDDDT